MKNKIIDIIDTLVQTTESNDLIWTERDPGSNKRSYCRDLVSTGEDGTKFEMEIKYHLINEQWVIETEPSLWIKNPSLPGGVYFIHGVKYDLTGLRNSIKEKYCTDMNPLIEDVENTLVDICSKISISTNRENKINKIL